MNPDEDLLQQPLSPEDQLVEHQMMLGYYRDGYWNETQSHFGALDAAPVLERSVHGIDLLAFRTTGGAVVHTTVGFGYPPPGSTRPKLEFLAVAEHADERIFNALIALTELASEATQPVQPYHKVSFRETPQGLPSRYFLLDGGMFEFGYDSRRIILVPVTSDEYDRFVVRDEAAEGDRMQALSILGLRDRAAPIARVPESLRHRW